MDAIDADDERHRREEQERRAKRKVCMYIPFIGRFTLIDSVLIFARAGVIVSIGAWLRRERWLRAFTLAPCPNAGPA